MVLVVWRDSDYRREPMNTELTASPVFFALNKALHAEAMQRVAEMDAESTAFTKDNLVKDGDCLYYIPTPASPYTEWRFVARFKYAAKSSLGPFATFLRRNFTVEEYFALVDADKSPLKIAESKGFVLSHIKKWLKRDGYPQTREGYEAWSAARRSR